MQENCVTHTISIHKALTSLDVFALCRLRPDTISIHKALTSLDHILAADDTGAAISIHKALTSLDSSLYTFLFLLPVFQSTRLSRASTERDTLKYQVGVISIHKALTSLDKSPFFVLTCPRGFQSTRLSRASTAKIHNYPCIHAKFIYLNYTPSTNHPASQKIFSYFNPIFRPFAVRIPLEFYVQLLFAPEFPY